jgi:hypothetical protein
LSLSSATSAPVACLLGAGLTEQIEDPWWATVVEWPQVLADRLDVEALPFPMNDEDDPPDPLRALASDSGIYDVTDLDRVDQLLLCDVLSENASDRRPCGKPSREVATRPGHISSLGCFLYEALAVAIHPLRGA